MSSAKVLVATLLCLLFAGVQGLAFVPLVSLRAANLINTFLPNRPLPSASSSSSSVTTPSGVAASSLQAHAEAVSPLRMQGEVDVAIKGAAGATATTKFGYDDLNTRAQRNEMVDLVYSRSLQRMDAFTSGNK